MGPRVTAIAVPTPFSIGTVNCYLVEAELLTLIDTGPNTDKALAALIAGIAATGRRLEDVELVVVTHQHYDHFGLAATVAERSGAAVAAHELLALFLADPAGAYEVDDAFAVAVMAAHGIDAGIADRLARHSRAERHLGRALEVTHRVRTGGLLDIGGTELRVLLRPGHTPTDTLFVDETSGRAFVGDHLIAHVSSNPIIVAPPTGADPLRPPRRVEEYARSLRATAELALTEALSGHGQPISDHHALAERRLRGFERRADRIHTRLGPEPTSAQALIDALWPSLPWEQTFLALSEVVGSVDLLETAGRAERVDDGGVVAFRRRGPATAAAA